MQLKRRNPLTLLNFSDEVFIKIGISAAYKNQVNIKTTIGSITAENLVLNNISLKSTTGNIEVHSIESKKALIKTTTEAISINGLVEVGIEPTSQATIMSTIGKITLAQDKLFTK
ncbi:DUF4097 family beta strand repeat-containing protein [Pediococcus pentosaceus]|uniref:DUF4097 family beta strand repeat-containing protein n=1 Tax=Pediococcus pentosaceus TaxID=1255 RepID=UPI003BA19B9F